MADFKERKRLEADQYPGRLISIIELGTFDNTWRDAKPGAKFFKVMLTFEISEMMEPNDDGEVLPYVLSQEYTMSFNEKANLAKMITEWGKKDWTEEERRDYDMSKLLDKPALVNVLLNEGKGQHAGRFFNNLGAITPLPKLMNAALIERVNPLVHFKIKDIGTDKFNTLYQWIRNKIMNSYEYKEFEKGETKQEPQKAQEQPSFQDDEEIPF